jgi:hypothetical protein
MINGMTQRLNAIFDGQVFRPVGQVSLPPNTRCTVTVQTSASDESPTDAWQLLDELAGTIDAPADWSSEHDHYLYGTPKKQP